MELCNTINHSLATVVLSAVSNAAALAQAGGQTAVRVAGSGPARVAAADAAAQFRFDSGSKTFLPLPSRAFTARTAGMAVQA